MTASSSMGSDLGEAALPFLWRACQADSGHEDAWINYIECLAALGRVQEAKATLEEASALYAKDERFAMLAAGLQSGGIPLIGIPLPPRVERFPFYSCKSCRARYDLIDGDRLRFCCGSVYFSFANPQGNCPFCLTSNGLVIGISGPPKDATCPVCAKDEILLVSEGNQENLGACDHQLP